ncbi:MAG TPA: hypothetical protein PLG59_05160 [bacterium]|nr:hypothetical protein [bacterium]
MCAQCTRREFMEAGAAGAIALSTFGGLASNVMLSAAQTPQQPIRVRVIFLAKPVPTWPTPYLDVQAECKRIDAELRKVAKQVPEIELAGGDLLRVKEDLEKLKGTMDGVDGIIVFNLTSTVGHLVKGITEYNIPTFLFSQPYSGHDWSTIADMQKKGKRIDVMATSDFNDLVPGLRTFRTVRRLRDSKILWTGDVVSNKFAQQVAEKFGTQVLPISGDQMMAAYEAADKAQAAALAREMISQAKKVVEPSKEEIEKSTRFYLAMQNMLREAGAQAIAINCLGMFREGKLPAYPCLGFARLNDDGLVGVCEGDLPSTLTMLTFAYLVERPGFISDPVIDTSKDAVIHAHCVAPTKMGGPDSKPCAYAIRSHMEDDKGAAMQVFMDIGQKITMARYLDADAMMISTGEIVDVPESDRGCRTKITTKVADARKMLYQYTGGLHRVIFYGDHVQDIYRLSHFLNFKVIEEC